MDIRTNISTVFHLDKCIGCHTCSISCKNLWTDRKGVEYVWFNNVETKPGAGYPHQWENQDKYKGGWERKKDKEGNIKIELKVNTRIKMLSTIFYNKNLPKIDDYYEPWTYSYEDLFDKESKLQPTARPISKITGQPMDIKYGPNWDDDLAGSEIYARNDLNLDGLTEMEKNQLNEIERLVFFYLPRMCNHCLNPSCISSCPSGAIYKRGEDGIVLINQNACRGWRMCVSGCPYQKAYYNWSTGKSEKCLLCFPRIETGQAPACFHTCVGRIRYLGVLLYDADKMINTIEQENEDLVEAQLDMIVDPNDPEVIKQAKQSGITDGILVAAKNSPVYKFVKEWKIALPLHPEYRTLPMLFYVPPLLPVIGKKENGAFNIDFDYENMLESMMSSLTKSRLPVKFMANLFTAGNEELIKDVYEKLITIRAYKRSQVVNDVPGDKIRQKMNKIGLTSEVIENIARLTSMPTYKERFVLPPLSREMGIELIEDPLLHKETTGLGFFVKPKRGG